MRSNSNAGFTLLETMIAMAIMMVAFSSILMVESSSINSSMRTKQLNVVAMLAKNIMVESEYLFEGKTFDEFKKEETGSSHVCSLLSSSRPLFFTTKRTYLQRGKIDPSELPAEGGLRLDRQ